MKIWIICNECKGSGEIPDREFPDLLNETCPFCKGAGGKEKEVEETGDIRNIPKLPNSQENNNTL